jgi:hypothetical protein
MAVSRVGNACISLPGVQSTAKTSRRLLAADCRCGELRTENSTEVAQNMLKYGHSSITEMIHPSKSCKIHETYNNHD